jgi:endonuclease/exonuclease/phosphatase (EEP) superfamily protein YafD
LLFKAQIPEDDLLMERIFLALTLGMFIQFGAFAQEDELVSEYFKRVPIEEAHTVQGQTRSTAFNPKSIKVLVWNIKKTQEVAWQQEFMNFSFGRELFLLQEAYPNELFTLTLNSFEDVRWDMGISFRYRLYDDLPTGTMIGSKVGPSLLLVKHSQDLEPMTETPKAMTFGKYPVTGSESELLVINVHGLNFTDMAAFRRNMAQIEEEILLHTGPVLVAGDFNTRTKERLAYLFATMKKHKMQEVTFKNGDQRMTAVMTKNFLDHGFVRGLKVKNAEVHGFALGSDHKPMTIEVSVAD